MASEAAAIARLRDLFYQQDYIGGADEGVILTRRFAESRELLAWRLVNMARADGPDEALRTAESMIASHPHDAWGWFAKSVALQFRLDAAAGPLAIAAGFEAYTRLPLNPDVQWVRGFSLSNQGEAGSAVAFLDSVARRQPLTVDLSVLYADALFAGARSARGTNQALVDSAIAIYARARAQSPENASAYTHAANTILSGGRSANEAYELAKRGVSLDSASRFMHQTYWTAIEAQKDRTDSSRHTEVLADIDRLLAVRGNSAIVLYGVSTRLGDLGQTQRQRHLEDRVLREHSNTASAEWVLIDRLRALMAARRDTSNHDPALVKRYKEGLWSFIDRPQHLRPSLTGEVYSDLFFLTDSSTSPDTLLRIVHGLALYDGSNPQIAFAAAALALADRGIALPEAERIARAGLPASTVLMTTRRSMFETIGDYARQLDAYNSLMYDALGWVYYREGRTDAAERELAHAYELAPRNISALFHLGEIARQRGDLTGAERFYVKGALVSGPGTNPNRTALRGLFEQRNGSLAGYDAYLANIAELDRRARKADIAKARIDVPTLVKAFTLRSLDGEVVSPETLKGKVVVLNHWNMSCGPCVAEMPELQKLAKKYAGDSAVRILTIDNDPDVTVLRQWLKARGYTFTTLIDDGYMTRSNITAWPTTWFLDAAGRVTFTKIGWSEQLVEEFEWRVDMLRHTSTTP